MYYYNNIVKKLDITYINLEDTKNKFKIQPKDNLKILPHSINTDLDTLKNISQIKPNNKNHIDTLTSIKGNFSSRNTYHIHQNNLSNSKDEILINNFVYKKPYEKSNNLINIKPQNIPTNQFYLNIKNLKEIKFLPDKHNSLKMCVTQKPYFGKYPVNSINFLRSPKNSFPPIYTNYSQSKYASLDCLIKSDFRKSNNRFNRRSRPY